MSLKTLLMPFVTKRMFSRKRLMAKRQRAESLRVARNRPHQVHYFHQVDDPYSALLAEALPRFAGRYNIELIPHLVSQPSSAAAPERERLIQYSRIDAGMAAAHHGLNFRDHGQQPDIAKLDQARLWLVSAIAENRFVKLVGPISEWLWAKDADHPMPEECNTLPRVNSSVAQEHIAESDRLRERLGHYLGGMLYYEEEWYWGIDRLYHLEERLRSLGATRELVGGFIFPPSSDLKQPLPLKNPPDIDFFFSFRSPYSAIVASRVFELGRLTGAKVNLRFVLPMVMRGLPVPDDKRQYIAHDAAREAHVRGTPFGKLNDPVGLPTERGLSLIPLAIEQGKGQEYVLSFMRGVWAEGIDAGSNHGLKKIAERAGLNWSSAQLALRSNDWRSTAEANREELFGLGLWGVPSFRVGQTAVWGQDRLWAVQSALVEQSQG